MFLTLIKHQQPHFDKIYLYVKDPLELNYQPFINGREEVEIKHERKTKAFIDYSQAIDVSCENLEDYNPKMKRIMLTVFDDMIASMEANKIHIVNMLLEAQYVTCFYVKIFFQTAERYKTKCDILFYHKDI